LILRDFKEGVGRRHTAVLNRSEFKASQVYIDGEIRDYFYNQTLDVLAKQVTDEVELHEYDPVADDTEKAFTYTINDKRLPFTDVVQNQLKANIPKIKDLGKILKDEGTIWAYCISYVRA
jgi:hypothetical protein